MAKYSAGLLVFRTGDAGLQVLLVHPGGPLWARRDEGAWSIPKGEYEPSTKPSAPAEAATREFSEELGVDPPAGPRIELGEVVQAGGKRVRAWAVEGDLDVSAVRSNTFDMEWPPRSGRTVAFPEIDRAAWFSVADARRKLVSAQCALVDRLLEAIDGGG